MVEPMTSTEKVSQKVESVIGTGDVPDIEDSYERHRMVNQLCDCIKHPDSSELVRERAQNAIEQICSE